MRVLWQRGAGAQTLSIGVRWDVGVPAGTQLRWIVGGIAINTRTTDAINASAVPAVVQVPITAPNAGTIDRETTTTAGYVVITLQIGDSGIGTLMLVAPR